MAYPPPGQLTHTSSSSSHILHLLMYSDCLRILRPPKPATPTLFFSSGKYYRLYLLRSRRIIFLLTLFGDLFPHPAPGPSPHPLGTILNPSTRHRTERAIVIMVDELADQIHRTRRQPDGTMTFTASTPFHTCIAVDPNQRKINIPPVPHR